jgi:hypothetical protein
VQRPSRAGAGQSRPRAPLEYSSLTGSLTRRPTASGFHFVKGINLNMSTNTFSLLSGHAASNPGARIEAGPPRRGPLVNNDLRGEILVRYRDDLAGERPRRFYRLRGTFDETYPAGQPEKMRPDGGIEIQASSPGSCPAWPPSSARSGGR